MADISVTATNVLQGVGATVVQGVAGAALTRGLVCYIDVTTGTWKKAGAASTAAVAGSGGLSICLEDVATGQSGLFQTGGSINPGGTVVVGGIYVVSATAGNIAQLLDAQTITGQFRTLVGVATTATNLVLMFYCGPANP